MVKSINNIYFASDKVFEMAQEQNDLTGLSTEEKIKQAARLVFLQKGFAATRTRDIAEAAGINLALLNYYFRSKQKLFDIIMLETIQQFLQSMIGVLNNEEASLEEKLEIMAGRYIDVLSANPEIPLFIMSEIRNNPDGLAGKIGIREVILQSHLVKQYEAGVREGKYPPQSLVQFLISIIGLIVFPFIARPMVKEISQANDHEFNAMMQERKKLIPIWIKALLSK